MDDKYKHPYKIDDIHRHVYRTKDGKPNGHYQYNTPPQNEFDLRNINWYNESGALVDEAKVWFYDMDFDNVAAHIKPVERLTDFLEYQYANTDRPDAFLKRIVTNSVLQSRYLKMSSERQSIIVKWAQEKSDRHAPFKEAENMDFANAVTYFNKEIETLPTQKAKEAFRNAHIQKTEKCIADMLRYPDLLQEAKNKNYFNGAHQFLEFLESKSYATLRDVKEPQMESKTLIRLKWLGNQKQLAELIITLEQNNWIEKIQDGDRAAICRTICELIDISGTKKDEKSNEVKSFTEIMKPDIDINKQATYSKVFTPQYKVKFKDIKKR